MPVINLLSREVSELIAAGEVVERPASAVKELMENAMDAGATSIVVEIKDGGKTFIRVSDNGCGIARSQLPKAILRNATSKVFDAEDLDAIATFGFRGEALASVCAVSRVEIITKTEDEEFASRLITDAEGVPEISDAGSSVGTTIIIRDLFYNVPARMKFLKKDSAEGAAVYTVVEKIALSKPEISIKFIKNEKVELQTPGDGKLLSAIYAVLSKEWADNMVEVDEKIGYVRVSGYVSKPEFARGNRGGQNFYINGRFVRTRTAMASLEQAYRNVIQIGKFPACVLNIEMPYETVDVNVHPAKTEVRFADEKAVFDAVYQSVKNAIMRAENSAFIAADYRGMKSYKLFSGNVLVEPEAAPADSIPSENPRSSSLPQDLLREPGQHREQTLSVSSLRMSFGEEKVQDERAAAMPTTRELFELSGFEREQENYFLKQPEAAPEAEESILPDDSYKVIGELFATYIIVQRRDYFFLIDKHAAHERMVFDKLKISDGAMDRQVLLIPKPVKLSPEWFDGAFENAGLIGKLGFSFDDFGQNTVLIREAPVFLHEAKAEDAFCEIAAKVTENSSDITPKVYDDLLHSIACRSAIKAGAKQTLRELEELVRVAVRDDVRYCPHGRPICVTFSRKEIERRFFRT